MVSQSEVELGGSLFERVGHTTQMNQREAGMASPNNPNVAFFKWKYFITFPSKKLKERVQCVHEHARVF